MSLQPLGSMPPIWKILLFSVLCLGLSPSWGKTAGGDESEALSAAVSVVFREDFSPKQEEVLTEKVTDDELAMVSSPSEPSFSEKRRASERELEKGLTKATEPTEDELFEGAPPEVKEVLHEEPKEIQKFKASDLNPLDHLGIRKLSPGINIFRYAHDYIKNRTPLAKGRMLPESSIQ